MIYWQIFIKGLMILVPISINFTMSVLYSHLIVFEYH